LHYEETKGGMWRPTADANMACLNVQKLLAAIALTTLTASSAFPRLAGFHWLASDTSIQIIGKTSIPNGNRKFCTAWEGKVECKDREYQGSKPDYYLLDCDRNRRVCAGTMAVILPSGDPWLKQIEYEITKWTPEHVIAVSTFFHRCVTTTLQIDLSAQEVLFTETYTRSLSTDPLCIPENIGYTTTFKLESYP
jgi:hypothetical protein